MLELWNYLDFGDVRVPMDEDYLLTLSHEQAVTFTKLSISRNKLLISCKRYFDISNINELPKITFEREDELILHLRGGFLNMTFSATELIRNTYREITEYISAVVNLV